MLVAGLERFTQCENLAMELVGDKVHYSNIIIKREEQLR